MGTITFDVTTFRAMFPAFAANPPYTDILLQMYYDTATAYVSDQTGGCYIYRMSLAQQTFALNLMTAHLAYLNSIITANPGQNTGVTTGATIDKVSVQLMPPPASNQWQFWLNQSPYGQQLLALLQVVAVGGMYFTARPPVVTSFR